MLPHPNPTYSKGLVIAGHQCAHDGLAGMVVVPDRAGQARIALQHFTGDEIRQLAGADRLVHMGTGTGKTRGAA